MCASRRLVKGIAGFLLVFALLLLNPFALILSASADEPSTRRVRPVPREPDAETDHERPYKPGELLIKYKRSAKRSASSRHAFIASTIKIYGRIGVSRVRLAEGRGLKEAVALLKNDPDVEHAEPNYQYRTAKTPGDPHFELQWALRKIGGPKAWDITSGTTTVVVAVVDTGVFHTHPDLHPNMWVNPGETPGNGIDDDGNGKVDDVRGWDFVQEDNDPLDLDGHGTHVSGILAGVGDNGIGIAGVGWSTRIMPLKGLNDSGVGYTSDLIEAIEYASENGAHIINCSWGSSSRSEFLKAAICVSPALVVCAAGNDSGNNDSAPYYPAGYGCPNMVSVAAADQGDRLASFSNYGLASVHVAAPGVNILSTSVSGTPPQAAYAYAGGTSMAAPHVSGIASLIKAQNPSLTAVQVKDAILSSVDIVPSLNGKTVSGGRVNGFGALPPNGPSGISVVNVSGNLMDLSWSDNASNETGFRIERKMGPRQTWSRIGTAAENASTYRDSTADGSEVQYRVLAYNGAAESAYSNIVGADSGPPTATLSYDAPDLNHVDDGILVITATFSELLNGAPGIKIDRPGSMSDISGSMSGSGTLWSYALNILPHGGDTVDGPYTVSLTAKDLLENSLATLQNDRFTTDTKDFDQDGIRDFTDLDDDNDGLPDEWEIRYGLNHQDPEGADGWDGDFDQDGWANWEELNKSDPGDPGSPRPSPPVIQEVNPVRDAGIKNAVPVPSNTAFAIRLKAAHGISLADPSGVTMSVSDGVTTYTRRLNDTATSGATLVQAVPLDAGAGRSESLWVVYYRSNESGVTAVFPHGASIGVSVYATDVRKDSVRPETFRFRIEGIADSVRAEEDRPKTKTSVQAGVTRVGVDEGNLRGAAILYDESVQGTGVTPYFGSSEEIPGLDLAGVNRVGPSMNLKPPAIFPSGVTLFIPAGYGDVRNLYVYYNNGEKWAAACNGAGDVLPGGEGWMVPGSRKNHNDGNPSTIEIRVYHFSAVLAGSAPPVPPPPGNGGGGSGGGDGGGPGGGGLTVSGGGAGGGGGGGCFIETLLGG